MRLFWKLFAIMLLTLLVTAGLSTWLSQKWLTESREIDGRLNTLASLGQTAVSLYTEEGGTAYQNWLRHTTRSQRFRGSLVDTDGNHVVDRPLRRHLQRLAEQAIREKRTIRIVEPPRLAVAMPIESDAGTYYWLAATFMTPENMKQGGKYQLLIRLGTGLLAIILVSWLLTRMLSQPVRMLQGATEQLGEGNLAVRVPHAVTRRRDEVGELGRSFDAMAAQLDSLIHSHKQLLRDISHELRSPLARLQVALELAKDSAGDAAGDELERIGREAERLNELIGEVLALARFEQETVQTKREPLQLDEILRDITEDAAFEAESMGKSVTLGQADPCLINGDRLWLGRALENVIRNAIRHTEANSTVAIDLASQGEAAKITVRDHGPGVPESALVNLFEPFFRTSEARDRHSGGYGLGLAIAQRAVQLNDGEIEAVNHDEGGLQVNITLPLA